ncbi:unnamed protein product [Lymnaea stagnalis]|uniref:Beta-mannosidase n=1 Tax=Lymnaea stagnalis TaxID=6523 RepID=A0AAV2HXK9_LYMST
MLKHCMMGLLQNTIMEIFFITGLLQSVKCFHKYSRIDLSGTWTVQDTSSGIKVLGQVPGSMYTALLNNGIIQDPLYRDNDVKLDWLGRADWTYSRTFSEPGDNSIFVQFTSAVTAANDRSNKSFYVIPPECPPLVQHGQCHVNQIRKEQCSFSWDWGPSFPTQGIWKPIYLDTFNEAIITDVGAVTINVNSVWRVVVDVTFAVAPDTEITGHLTANLAGLNLSHVQDVTISSSKTTTNFILAIPEIINVPLWWPNNYGAQPLFNLSVTLTTPSDQSQRSIKLGFRMVELVQTQVSQKTENGLTFYFRINGIPIFLKGSNWIPADSFQERITKDKLQFLLGSAAVISINSMRVWGGGVVYESDEFYELCDELGIMIWQDFMFSVAMYPTSQEFLDSVATEVKQQACTISCLIQRLKHHPSIIVWAGNNENEKGLRQNWFGTDKNFSLYYSDYLNLYVKTIKPIVKEEDQTRVYLTSSPSDGKETEKEGYVAQDPDSEFYGDIHFYNYLADQWGVADFRIPRMASEFGVQAWCNNESLAKVFLPSDYAMNSNMVNHRQHHAEGNLEMAAEVALHLNLPTSPDPKQRFVDFIYLSQINQAMSIRSQTEHYRRHQSQLLSDGRGLTMGALYWQLNDIWQAPTWASIDYEGSWKMLHYYAKLFFSKHLISPFYRDNQTLDVYIVLDEIPIREVRNPYTGVVSFEPFNYSKEIKGSKSSTVQMSSTLDHVTTATNGFLKIEVYQYTNWEPLCSWNVSYNLKSTAESVFTKRVADLLSESGCQAKEKCLLYFTATDGSGIVLSKTWFTLTYPKDAVIPKAKVQIVSVVKLDTKVFEIDISSDAVALYVWLATDDIKGYFSDNGFPMISFSAKVKFYAVSDVRLAQLSSQLRVRSLIDVV